MAEQQPLRALRRLLLQHILQQQRIASGHLRRCHPSQGLDCAQDRRGMLRIQNRLIQQLDTVFRALI